jgi:pre-mRNA-splicing factor SYF1
MRIFSGHACAVLCLSKTEDGPIPAHSYSLSAEMAPEGTTYHGQGTYSIESLLPREEDLIYEEELLRQPYNLKLWLQYVDSIPEGDDDTNKAAIDARIKRQVVYERALKALPGSYKLWYKYLLERKRSLERGRYSLDSPLYSALNNTFERALISMYKMPRIWLEYLEFLVSQGFVTRARRAFDRALMALPVTQHDRIWVLYLKFVSQDGIPVETATRVYSRYLKIEPAHAEEYIVYLRGQGRWRAVAEQLIQVVNDTSFRSLEGKSKHDLWMELCDVITSHPDEMEGLRVEDIVRGAISKYKDEVGRLWTTLADYHIRRGLFEKARDVYTEGLTSIVTVRDFSLIYDALTQFEEALIASSIGDDEGQEEDSKAVAGDAIAPGDFLLHDTGNDLELRLARLEHLIERRPELLNSVILRQNPHNVNEWHKRAKLFPEDAAKRLGVYAEAVKTVDPSLAVGNPHSLWIAFAKVYESSGDLDNARAIFDKAAQYPFLYVDNLATIWTERIEMELRHENFSQALHLARLGTTVPPVRRSREEEASRAARDRLYRSSRLWSLRLDLEESLGTSESIREAYSVAMDTKVVTAQMVLNYASYLKENGYFEDSFKAYERGIASFKYPHLKDIWTAYLQDFTERYKGTKVERTRELFREACEGAPPDFARPFYVKYATYEEEFGLARNAMNIYETAVKNVKKSDRLQLYELYITKALEFFGIAKVREIYESAIESTEYPLSDEDTLTLVLQYSNLERKLGEVDRARAILVHGSSIANPAKHASFWKAWNSFEVRHGNEETFREMLRIKRSVAASFSDQHFNTAIIDAASMAVDTPDGVATDDDLNVEDLPPVQTTRVPGFVSAGVIQQGKSTADEHHQENPENIDLDDEDENDAAAPV